MKIFTLGLLGIVTALTTGAQGGKGATKCTDVPLVWTLHHTAPDGTATAIYGDADGSVQYQDGVGGVRASLWCAPIINYASLSFSQPSKRTIGYEFGAQLYWIGPPTDPPLWLTSPFLAKGLLNISDFDYVPPGYTRGQAYTFKTWFNSQLPDFNNPKNQAYSIKMFGPLYTDPRMADVPQGGYPNFHYDTSVVLVTHTPATGTTKETWTVTPDPVSISSTVTTPVATLQQFGSLPPVNLGQFSMPFYFTISVK